MDRKIVPFPAVTTNAEDPAMARTLFFGEIAFRELVSTIPPLVPREPDALF